MPAVGTEASGTSPSAIPAFALAGLSTVDSVDTSAGRLGLVLLLAGAEPGSYGVGETAERRRAAVDSTGPAAGLTSERPADATG